MGLPPALYAVHGAAYLCCIPGGWTPIDIKQRSAVFTGGVFIAIGTHLAIPPHRQFSTSACGGRFASARSGRTPERRRAV
jgi:hypothetical protein